MAEAIKGTILVVRTVHVHVLLLYILYTSPTNQVFQIAYCYSNKKAEWEAICSSFVTSMYLVHPTFIKIHLLLHLVECMPSILIGKVMSPIQVQTLPLLSISRCKSFNGLIHNQNICSNRHAPSRDIAHSFAVMESIRYICDSQK